MELYSTPPVTKYTPGKTKVIGSKISQSGEIIPIYASGPVDKPKSFFPEIGAGMGKMGLNKETVTGSVLAKDTNLLPEILPEKSSFPVYKKRKFKAPEYDERAVSAKAQMFAGASLRELRNQIQKINSRRYDNPNVAGYELKRALEGYGVGLGKIMQQAYAKAEQTYALEYQKLYQEAVMNFREEQKQAQNEYEAAFARWNRTKNNVPKELSPPKYKIVRY